MVITTVETIGRLPTPSAALPLDSERFAGLCEHWRGLHVWLSMWDNAGNCVSRDEDSSTFWTRLSAPGSVLSEGLRSASLSAEGAGDEPKPGTRTGRPFDLDDDIAIISVPVLRRRRRVGSIVGACIKTRRLGEDFERICGRSGLDAKSMRTAAGDAGMVSPESLDMLERFLRLTVEQARDLETANEEAEVLTHNLENTYEELHLIYEISRRMRLPQETFEALRQIGEDVLEVSRAARLAFVLDVGMVQAPISEPGPSHGRSPRRVVRVGECRTCDDSLERLADVLPMSEATKRGHLLVNQPQSRDELAWTSPWLKHLVALPLVHEHRVLGVLLAMDCKDEGDFNSVDVQLFRAVADRVAAFLDNHRLYSDLAQLLMGMLHAMVNSIDAKDPYTCGHSERVAFISRAIASAAGLSSAECERVYLAGLLHDVGKIGVPDAILCKPGKLTKEEFDVMKKHPEVGAKILSGVKQISDLLPGVLYHHERMDGRGYPQKLMGRDIPLLGRIICLADCFDAMTTSRTYRAALPLPMAVSEIRRCSGTQFDPALASFFVGLDAHRLLSDAHASCGKHTSLSQLGALDCILHEGRGGWAFQSPAVACGEPEAAR